MPLVEAEDNSQLYALEGWLNVIACFKCRYQEAKKNPIELDRSGTILTQPCNKGLQFYSW